MTTEMYIKQLAQALESLPAQERADVLAYYTEFLEDASEAEREALGTPETLAQRILHDSGIGSTPSDTPPAPAHRNLALYIVIAVVTSPIWLSLLVAFWAIVLSCVITLGVLLVALGAACLIGIIGGIVVAVALGDIGQLLFGVGSGLLCGGFFLLLAKPLVWLMGKLCWGAAVGCRKLWQCIF